MTEKPFKTSNYTGGDLQNIQSHIRSVDSDLRRIVTYLNTFPRVFRQSTEPTVGTDGMAFWKDTDNGKIYWIKDVDGTQKKVELT